MAVIDQVVQHFRDKNVLKSFDVPEWGKDGVPLTIYVEPFTLKQQHDVKRRVIEKRGDDFISYLIQLKALDENRKKIFWGEGMKLLNQADPDVSDLVALKIMNLAKGDPVDKDVPNAEDSEEDEYEEMSVESVKKN